MFLFTTDFRYISVPLIVIIFITVVLYFWHWHNSRKNTIHVYDFTYRDDKGNIYLVTAVDVHDAYEILRTEHGLSSAYLSRHVYLIDTKEVF